MPENSAAGTSVGDPVTAADGDGDVLTYALTGSSNFAIDAAGRITVASSATLDYETQASYPVTVTVHDGENADGAADSSVDDSIEITISVLNVDEAGTVSLVRETGVPEAGSELSAVLLDPDGGVIGLAWAWERSADRSAWTAIAGATGDAYTPTTDDEGQYLRATASYADGHGPGKSARAATAIAVALPPAQPVEPPQLQTTGPTAQTVPAGWALIPKDSSNNPIFTAGQSFRLLFLTRFRTALSSSDIAIYNTHAQTAANSDTTLRPFKGEFRAVVSTSAVDARDNTATAPAGSSYTTGEGVPIYWLGGDKVADNYADFYDGSWNSKTAKSEIGVTSDSSGVGTGSQDDGTKHATDYMGAATVRWGHLTGSRSPLSHTSAAVTSFPLARIYAISPVITIADITAPTVSSVAFTSSPASGQNSYFKIGDTITATATFSEAVTVTGAPTLVINVGTADKSAACAAHASNTAKLVCSYTVADGDTDTDGIAIAQNKLAVSSGVTIKDGADNVAVLTHSAVAADSTRKVDGIRPKVTHFSMASTPAQGGDTYWRGEKPVVAIHFSEPVTGTDITAGGLSLDINYASGGSNFIGVLETSPAQDLTDVTSFKMGDNAVPIRDDWFLKEGISVPRQANFNNIDLSAGSIKDAAGNAANLNLDHISGDASKVGPFPGHKVNGSLSSDTALPTVTAGPAITSSPGSDQTYGTGDAITVRLTFSEAVDVDAVVSVEVQVGDNTRLASISSDVADTTTADFSYTVVSGDADANGISIAANSVVFGSSSDGITRKDTSVMAAMNHAALSDQSGHKVDGNPPSAPTLTATTGNTQVTLSWTDPSDSTITKYQYQVKAGAGSYGSWTDIPSSSASTTSHTVTNLTNGTLYTFKIRAVDAGNEGAESNEATATPADAPTITAVAVTSSAPAVTSDSGTTHNYYQVGDDIEVTLTFSRAIAVTGAPQLTIRGGHEDWVADCTPNGGDDTNLTCGYSVRHSDLALVADCAAHASDNTKLVCTYTVQPGDTDYDGIEVEANQLTLPTSPAATIKDGNGAAAILTHAAVAADVDHFVWAPESAVTPDRFAVTPGDRQAALHWTIPRWDFYLARWQYRYKAGSGSYGSWRNIPGSSINSWTYTLRGLRNDTAYTIQIRGVNKRGVAGKPSVERTITPKALTAPVGQTVPADWRLIPDGVGPGQSFRLMFLTYDLMTAESTDIEAYNDFVQAQAGSTTATDPPGGASVAELRPFSGEFRALISTATVDARNNTATTGRGAPIYWVRDGSIGDGDKVADNYADFYDGSWDMPSYGYYQGGDQKKYGALWTGSRGNGTKDARYPAGSILTGVRFGNMTGPGERIHGGHSARGQLKRLYAISPVLTVAR